MMHVPINIDAEFSLADFYSWKFQKIDLNNVEIKTFPVSFLQNEYVG